MNTAEHNVMLSKFRGLYNALALATNNAVDNIESISTDDMLVPQEQIFQETLELNAGYSDMVHSSLNKIPVPVQYKELVESIWVDQTTDADVKTEWTVKNAVMLLRKKLNVVTEQLGHMRNAIESENLDEVFVQYANLLNV